MQYVNGSNTYAYTYNDEGIRTSKTVNGVTHTYHLSGSQIVAEEWGNNLLVYLYDAEGAPLGMQYRNTTYAANVFDTYWFEKNMQGDIVAVYNDAGTLLISYLYDAWGNVTTTYSNGGASTNAVYNPFKYRGYYHDSETGWYYLQSRYYNPNWGRFISADDSSVIAATPMGLTDKNLYAYCDNNPIMREDSEGNFWLVSVAVGLATQYVGDVIGNLIDGKTGADIFKPTSSVGEYIAAGVTALIPGAGLGGALVRNIVAEGIAVIEDAILGNEVNIVDSMINVGLGTVLDVGFEKVSDKAADFISSKMPKNYSSYAHTARQSNPNLTREQIYRSMQRSIRCNRFASKAVSIGFEIVRSTLPY